MMSFKVSKIRSCVLLIASSVLFALADSISVWLVFVPVLFLVHYSDLKTAWLYGGFYGALSYLIFIPWLFTFSKPAAAGVCVLYFIFCAVLFTVMKTAEKICGKSAWIVEWLILCAYEYLKTAGFLGFSYGVSAYTQWKNITLIQCCSLFGIWGLTALIDFFSAWVYIVTLTAIENRKKLHGNTAVCVKIAFAEHAVSGGIWFCCLLAALIYGTSVPKDYSKYEHIKAAAVQNNSDPWKGGFAVYKTDVQKLMELTDQALAADPEIKLVVWPETSVVPSIIKNYYMRIDRKRYELVRELLEYIDSKECDFIIGNYHAEEFEGQTEDYNCAFLFSPGKNVIPPQPEKYAKIHLVPFTEYFPYPELFPHIYKMLLAGDTHLWTPGNELKVFSSGNLHFSTPICFEDTFGNICRDFVNKGSRAFINLSNDAWSGSLRCQNQHLAMAVFRSVENRVPSVRSTASGQTCIIDPCGNITVMSAPFEENYVIGEIPVIGQNRGTTLYGKIGDAAGKIFVIAVIAALLCGMIATKIKMR